MYDHVYHTCTYTCVHVGCPNVHVPYCPAVTSSFLWPTSKKKRGEGVTTRTCAFASQLTPPPPRIRVLRSMKLCCEVEDENSFDRHAVAVLKDGRVVGHVHVAILPVLKLFSTRLIHECNSFTLNCNTRTRAVPQTGLSGPLRGRVMEVK